MVEMRDNGPEATRAMLFEAADTSRNRSVYLPLLRGVTPKDTRSLRPGRADTGDRQPRRDHRSRPGVVPAQLLLRAAAIARRRGTACWPRRPGEADAAKIESAYRLDRSAALPTEGGDRAGARRSSANTSLHIGPSRSRPPPKAKPAAPKPKRASGPKEQPANPDEIDQTGEAVVTDEVCTPEATPEECRVDGVHPGAVRQRRVPLREDNSPSRMPEFRRGGSQ